MKPSHTGDGIENLRVSELERKLSKLTVSVLPDFFFDRIVSVPSIETLFKQIERKAIAGGGNLRGYVQTEIRGGNAANLGAALAALSVKVRLHCIGDGRVRGMFAGLPKNCELHIIPGRPGFTVALEFQHRHRAVNVMVCDDADLSSFDGRSLSQREILGLKQSDLIALVNWSGNLKGNQLARRVFTLGGRRKRVNFLDPADLGGVGRRIAMLAKMIARENLVDVLSLNENEARLLTRAISVRKLPYTYRGADVLRAAKNLHDELQTTVDIHTPFGSASACRDDTAWERAASTAIGFATGAGDAWDAGDIIGHLTNLRVNERLRFANASAYLYLKSDRTHLPTVKEVLKLMTSTNVS